MTEPCPDWLSPAPFRAHVRDLVCETGLPWRMIAAHAGVAPRAIRGLLHGRRRGPTRRLHVSVARALAATSVESINAADRELTDIGPVRRLLAELRRLGCPDHILATHLNAADVDRLDDPESWLCSRGTAARVTACYDLLTEARVPHPGRAPQPLPLEQHVVCSQQHLRLDRKQTPWPIDYSSNAIARSS